MRHSVEHIRQPGPNVLGFLSAALTRSIIGLNIVHLVAGRGAGKSFAAAFALFISAFEKNPGLPHLWAAPTIGDITDTFLPIWEVIAGPEDGGLWKHDKAKNIIYTVNGTKIFLRGRLATNANRDPFRGPSFVFAVFDEARQDPTAKAWKTLLLGVRGDFKGRQKTIITTSTPLLGWYSNVINNNSDPVFRATSYDNPVADHAAIERAKEDYDERLIRQEIYGEDIALNETPWQDANLLEYFPNGNLHQHEWDPSLPYTLFVDIGRKSAWLLVQTIPKNDDIWSPSPETIDVAVAEYTPASSSTEVIARRIEDEYGPPGHVIIGSDLNTKDTNSGDDTSAVTILRSVGWQCTITPIHGFWTNKQVQYHAAARCLLNAHGHRQFCVSDKLRTYDKNHCGIKEVLLQDQWPDPTKPGYFDKDKKVKGREALEDMRDCWLYGMTVMHPIRSHKQPGANWRKPA